MTSRTHAAAIVSAVVVATVLSAGACKKDPPTTGDTATTANGNGNVKSGASAHGTASGSPSASASSATKNVDPRAEKFCREFHGVSVERRAACCHTPSAGNPEQAECVLRLSDALARGAVALDDKAVETCLADRKRAVEGCDWVTPGSPTAPASCRSVLVAHAKRGGACRSSLECETGDHCEAGKCEAASPIGGGCAMGVDPLAAATGHYAVERDHPPCADFCNGVTHKCEEKPAVGARCFTNAGCSEGMACVAGACAKGGASKLGESCKKTPCDDGLVCRAGTCKARGKAGDSCDSDLDCAVGGCRASGDAGGARTCGMTCSHAGDLDAIKAKLGAGGK